jgi:hypothetical protein
MKHQFSLLIFLDVFGVLNSFEVTVNESRLLARLEIRNLEQLHGLTMAALGPKRNSFFQW